MCTEWFTTSEGLAWVVKGTNSNRNHIKLQVKKCLRHAVADVERGVAWRTNIYRKLCSSSWNLRTCARTLTWDRLFCSATISRTGTTRAPDNEKNVLRFAEDNTRTNTRATGQWFLNPLYGWYCQQTNAFIPSATRLIIETCGLSISDDFCYFVSSTEIVKKSTFCVHISPVWGKFHKRGNFHNAHLWTLKNSLVTRTRADQCRFSVKAWACRRPPHSTILSAPSSGW